jgi:hypothetical protein
MSSCRADALLAGKPVPSWPDEEKTLAESHERLGKAIDYLASFAQADFAGTENRPIDLKLGPHEMKFTNAGYIAAFVLANFFSHVTEGPMWSESNAPLSTADGFVRSAHARQILRRPPSSA